MSLNYQRFLYGRLIDENGSQVIDSHGNAILVRNRGEEVFSSDPQYRVYIYRRLTKNIYDSNYIEITDYVQNKGMGEVALRVENDDFDVGVFSFDSLDLTLINHPGLFSNEKDPRSIFAYRRDQTKVVVEFIDRDGNATSEFRGFVQEDHTAEDTEGGIVRLSVLSRDAIFRRIYIRGGAVPSGATVRQALDIVLNRPAVLAVLQYDPDNINPPLNPVLDDTTEYDNKAAIEILDSLMLICGGILLVNDNDEIIVRDRTHNATGEFFSTIDVDGDDLGDEEDDLIIETSPEDTADLYPWRFYGAGDLLARQNVIELSELRNGLNRAFNQFKIQETVSFDDVLIKKHGFKEKTLDIDRIVTNQKTRQAITDYYLSQFAVPRRECEITVRTADAIDVRLLDAVLIDYPKLLAAAIGRPAREGLLVTGAGEYVTDGDGNYIEARAQADPQTLPFYNRAKYGSALYGRELSKTVIDARIAWKVIEKRQDVDALMTTLKVREIGTQNGGEIW